MEKIERLKKDKRGQEGMGLGTILAILLGVGALTLIILFFTGFFGKLGTGLEAVSNKLAIAEAGCSVAVQSTSVSAYCYQFRDVGNGHWVNCLDTRIQDGLKVREVNEVDLEALNSGCTQSTILNDWNSHCNTLSKKGKGSALLNNQYSCPETE